MNKLRWFFLALLVQGLGCLVYFLAIPADPKNIWLFGLSPYRLGLTLVFVLAILFSLFMIWSLHKQSNWANIIYSITGQIYFYNSRLLLVACLSIIVIIFCVGFFLYWYFLGYQYHAVMLRLSPLVLFVLLSNSTFLFTIRTRLHQTWLSSGLLQSIHRYFSKYRALEIMIVAFFIIMGIFYFELATDHAKNVNNASNTVDQSAYLDSSERAWESNFKYMGDRNRMPEYAFLQAVFYRQQ